MSPVGRARIRVASPAKINLCLGVGPARPDGYHPLATVYQAVGLYDELELAETEGASTLEVVGEGVDVAAVPTGPQNLVLTAAQVLADHHRRDLPVAARLRKRIPVAGGLAGGSTDAAATLVALDALHDLRTPLAELLALAGGLGSDVPFCLLGGTAVGTGRGERVTPLPTSAEFWWAIVPDAEGLSTPAVYAEFDRLHGSDPVPDPVVPDDLLTALRTGDPRLLGRSLVNDLEPAALTFRPDLADLVALGRDGADSAPRALGALISGSGPTVAFLCADAVHARGVADHLARSLSERGHPWSAPSRPLVVCAPAPGARVVEPAGGVR